MMQQRYLEDFVAGDQFDTETFTISREEIVAFAKLYDPQPFHLDEAAAATSFFGQLVASGWQTASITMRLMVRSGLFGSGLVGAGVDELRWTLPVAPGDTLRVHGEVVEKKSLPGKRRGFVRFRIETFNQNDVPVLTMFTSCVVPLRPQA